MKEKEKKSTDMTINTVIQLMQWFMAIKICKISEDVQKDNKWCKSRFFIPCVHTSI